MEIATADSLAKLSGGTWQHLTVGDQGREGMAGVPPNDRSGTSRATQRTPDNLSERGDSESTEVPMRFLYTRVASTRLLPGAGTLRAYRPRLGHEEQLTHLLQIAEFRICVSEAANEDF